jgi:hypothetical protein
MRRLLVPMPFPVPAQERYVTYDMMLNDIGFWYPILTRAEVLTPKTIIVNQCSTEDFPVNRIKAAMDEIGYPCFFRGGNISASLKHHWKDTCFVEKPLIDSEIYSRCLRVVKHCIDGNQGAEPLLYSNWAIREFIKADTVGTYRDMPLKREIRAFIKDNAVHCLHDYWQDQAPAEFSRNKLITGNKRVSDVIADVYKEAEKVAKYFYGYWSCDFMLSQTGEWYAIDMALGEDSYHHPDCQKLAKGIVNKELEIART